jgi:hypothetical protein
VTGGSGTSPEVIEQSPMTPVGKRAGLFTTIDQVLFSASNAILLFTLAQVSTVDQFGLIALLIGVVSTWIGFNRGALGTPILLVASLTRKDVLAEAGYATAWAVVTGVAAGAVLIALGALVDSTAIAIGLAVAVPAVLVLDVQRFAAISLGRADVALWSDSLWTVCMCALFAVNMSGFALAPQASVLWWGVSGLLAAGLIAATTSCTPRWHRMLAWWRTYAHSRLRFGNVQALNAASATAVTFVVTAIAGAAVAGGLRGASTLFGPIAMLVSALPMVFIPHARRSGQTVREQWRVLLKTALLTSAATTLVTAAVLATPHALGEALLGQTWEPAAAVAPYIGLNSAAGCWMVTIYALFQVQGASRAAFHVRNFQLVLQLGASALAAALFASAVAVGIALAVGCWLSVLLGAVLARRVVARSDNAPPPTPTVPPGIQY